MQDKEFAAILQDEPMQPLALVPLTEEEQVRGETIGTPAPPSPPPRPARDRARVPKTRSLSVRTQNEAILPFLTFCALSLHRGISPCL